LALVALEEQQTGVATEAIQSLVLLHQLVAVAVVVLPTTLTVMA